MVSLLPHCRLCWPQFQIEREESGARIRLVRDGARAKSACTDMHRMHRRLGYNKPRRDLDVPVGAISMQLLQWVF